MNLFKASWKTTAAGVVIFLGIFFGEMKVLFDDDDSTNPDWNNVAAAVGALWLGLSARDNNVSSEKAGAK